MSSSGGERAQSIQIGTLFVFAFLVIGLSLTQAFIVPDENAQVEFNHNQRVQDDMVDLRSDLLRSAATGRPRSTTVQLGTSFPPRALLVNPPPPSGTLRTESAGTVTLENVEAVDPETADYLNGNDRTFSTRRLSYRPDYSVYENAPTTVLEGSVLYNRFDGSDVVVERQNLVSGDDLTVTTLAGEFSVSRAGATSVEPTVVSGPRKRVTVEGAGGGNITVTVPTRLGQAQWETMLASQTVGNGGYVVADSISVSGGDLTFELAGRLDGDPVRYDLRMGAVGVGTGLDPTDDEPYYVTTASGDGATLLEGQTENATVSVRDRYNNPVGAGVRVSVTWPGTQVGHVTFPRGAATDENGNVFVKYHAPINVDTRVDPRFEVRIDDRDLAAGAPGTPANVTDVSLTVEDDDEDVSEAYDRPLVTAVEPDAGNQDLSFVRIYFPPGVDRAGWDLNGTDDVRRSLPDADAEVAYFAVDETAFGTERGDVPGDEVYQLPGGTTGLDPEDGALALVEEGTDRVVDEVAYDTTGNGDDRSTENGGWNVDVSDTTDTVFYRITEDPEAAEPDSEGGTYVETNQSSDWETQDSGGFFGDGGNDASSPTGSITATSTSGSTVTVDWNASSIGGSDTVEIVLENQAGSEVDRKDITDDIAGSSDTGSTDLDGGSPPGRNKPWTATLVINGNTVDTRSGIR